MFFNQLSIKEAVIAAIKSLPDNCNLEQIIIEINSLGSLLESYKDVERGQFLTQEELLKRVGDAKD